jgi:hypothetical protein
LIWVKSCVPGQPFQTSPSIIADLQQGYDLLYAYT